MNRVAFGVIAVALCVLGFVSLLQRRFYDVFYSHYFDFGDHHVVVGVLFLGVGAWLAYHTFKKNQASRD